ncbi:MAG: hypothetical protein ACK5NF_02245 [Bacilli bacterium]
MKFLKKNIILIFILLVLLVFILVANYNDYHRTQLTGDSDTSEVTGSGESVHLFQLK